MILRFGNVGGIYAGPFFGTNCVGLALGRRLTRAPGETDWRLSLVLAWTWLPPVAHLTDFDPGAAAYGAHRWTGRRTRSVVLWRDWCHVSLSVIPYPA